jgi:hypothetical protein
MKWRSAASLPGSGVILKVREEISLSSRGGPWNHSRSMAQSEELESDSAFSMVGHEGAAIQL